MCTLIWCAKVLNYVQGVEPNYEKTQDTDNEISNEKIQVTSHKIKILWYDRIRPLLNWQDPMWWRNFVKYRTVWNTNFGLFWRFKIYSASSVTWPSFQTKNIFCPIFCQFSTEHTVFPLQHHMLPTFFIALTLLCSMSSTRTSMCMYSYHDRTCCCNVPKQVTLTPCPTNTYRRVMDKYWAIV